jgi:predicted phosphate transport protein (TIGR00153 family)
VITPTAGDPVRLLPRDERFFDLFTAVAERSVEAANLLEQLLKGDANRRGHLVDQIKRLEHEADQLTHEVVTRLDRSFITPLDREDIYTLASRLDDVIDQIDGLARRSQIFHVAESPTGAILLAEVIKRITEELLTAVKALATGKNGIVLPACIAVKRLEEEGDFLYHEWLGKLFEGTPDPLTVIKWKEIYDNLEKTLDRAEDAANVLESISIKHG